MRDWKLHLLGTKKRVEAVTTEDRLWSYVAEQADLIKAAAENSAWDNTKKQQAVEAPYHAIREAFKQLGVIR